MNIDHKYIQADSVYFSQQRQEPIKLVDAQLAEYADGHAQSATNIPLGNISVEALHQQLGDWDPHLEPVALLCEAGTRAEQAAQKLGRQGFDNFLLVAGGTNAGVR